MKHLILSVLLTMVSVTKNQAQQVISFEETEGYTLGNFDGQNGWEVSSHDGVSTQVLSAEKASNGLWSFKNDNEPTLDWSNYPDIGAHYYFETPKESTNFSISYDINVQQRNGSDYEFTIFATDNEGYKFPIAGVGVENRGYIYLTTSENFGFAYAEKEWRVNQWLNVRIELTETEINYYLDNELELSVDKFAFQNIEGFNMLHNNFGGVAYYDNFRIIDDVLHADDYLYSGVKIFPNPVHDELRIISESSPIQEVIVFNSLGQQLVHSNGQLEKIDVTSFDSGVYTLKMKTYDGRDIVQKFIKK